MHPSIRTYIFIQSLVYVEVANIMVFNPRVSNPNKHELTPDFVGERLWRLSCSCEHIVDRRERRGHTHARTHADTHTHTRMHTET